MYRENYKVGMGVMAHRPSTVVLADGQGQFDRFVIVGLSRGSGLVSTIFVPISHYEEFAKGGNVAATFGEVGAAKACGGSRHGTSYAFDPYGLLCFHVRHMTRRINESLVMENKASGYTVMAWTDHEPWLAMSPETLEYLTKSMYLFNAMGEWDFNRWPFGDMFETLGLSALFKKRDLAEVRSQKIFRLLKESLSLPLMMMSDQGTVVESFKATNGKTSPVYIMTKPIIDPSLPMGLVKINEPKSIVLGAQ